MDKKRWWLWEYDDGGGPMVLKLGRNVRYELASLLRFVESPNIPTQKKTAAS